MNYKEEKNFILLGGSQAIFDLAKEIIKKNLELLIVTDHLHLNERINEKGTLKDNLDSEGLGYIICDKMSKKFLEKYVKPETIGLSICSVWVFKQDVIDLFQRRLYNIHGARLPKHGGGGGYSWKILSQDNLGGFAIHKIEAGIDTGDIVYFKEFTFPPSCRIPQDYYDYAQKVENEILSDFLNVLISEKPLKPFRQMECFSSYWPRLNTERNGYIDWQWSVENLGLFINAFDDPYAGAMTFMNNKRVHLKKCFITKGEGSFHPFQAGIIFRKYNGNLFIAAMNGTIVVSNICDDKEDDIFREIIVGDRLYTPRAYLEEAKKDRIIYNSKGVKE